MGGEPARQLAVLSITALAGTGAGLLISSVSRSTDQANAIVPMALIPQILLANAVISPLPTVASALAKLSVSGFWVFRALENSDTAAASAMLLLHLAAYVAGCCRWLSRRRYDIE
jgi:hypothetical protein